MAVTTTYSWTFLSNIDLGLVNPGANAEVISLAGRGFAVSGDHTSHVDGDIFSSTGAFSNSWNDGAVNNGGNSALAQLTNGNIVQVSQDADSILYEIVSSSGATVLASTDIGDNGPSAFADVAALTGGGFVIANDDFFSGVDYDIDLRFYNSAGVFQTVVTVDGTAAQDQNVSVAGLTNGNVVVTWTRTVAGDTEVWDAIYDSAGGVVVAASILDSFGTINRNVSVCALANGGYAVAYEDNGWGTGTVDITVETFTSVGAFVNSANITDPAFTGDGSGDANPYIAELANGMLVVAYSDNSFGDTDTKVILLSSNLNVLAEDNITAGAGVTDDVESAAIAGFGLGQVAVVHTNVIAGENQGELLQAVRTSTGDSANNIITGDDFIDIMTGDAGNDRLNGRGNTDTLTGGTGRDRLDGGNGADILNGNGSVDTLLGGAGSDKLNGGAGNDTLTGGANPDYFVFTTAFGATNRDTITDYSVAEDTIRIDNAVFTGLAAGALGASQFHIGVSASDASDRIIYDFATGKLYFDVDGAGGAAQIQFATLSVGLGMTAADFIVI